MIIPKKICHVLIYGSFLWMLCGAVPGNSQKVPGAVIDYRSAAGKEYLGSPSIAILPNGEYLVSHDFFGPGSTKDRTVIFASKDRGRTWTERSGITGQWWSTLFMHRHAVYLMGTSREYGFVVIRRSDDGGRTWTEPADEDSGLLLDDGKYHCAPVPVVLHHGRLWRAMEDAMGPGGWGSHFRSFVMSAAEDSDLLKAGSWVASNRLGRNPDWLNGHFGGWLEGNVVIDPSDQIINILRADFRTGTEKAAIIRISADGEEASFDEQTGFIDFPGGCKKFTIRYDSVSKSYWSLTNYVPSWHESTNPERVRNTLALISSEDLKNWQVQSVILYHPDTRTHGFQYADWLFDGKDLIAAVRTAYDDDTGGAHNQHDANYIIFYRVKNFRKRTMKDSPKTFLKYYDDKP